MYYSRVLVFISSSTTTTARCFVSSSSLNQFLDGRAYWSCFVFLLDLMCPARAWRGEGVHIRQRGIDNVQKANLGEMHKPSWRTGGGPAFCSPPAANAD